MKPPASPCTGVCTIGQHTERCEGCDRTLSEITNWGQMSAATQWAIVNQLATRRATRLSKCPATPVEPQDS